MLAQTVMTVEELVQLPERDVRRELIQGELIEMVPPNARHGAVAARLAAQLLRHVEARGLGSVGVESGFVLHRDPDTVCAPDVSFVRADRVPAAGEPEAYWEGPPDLAVEILSPSDQPDLVAQKTTAYLRAGTRMVWLVDPAACTVTVHGPGTAPRTLSGDEQLPGGHILRGLEVAVAELFS